MRKESCAANAARPGHGLRTWNTPRVTCVRCERAFEAFASTQAHDCASDILGDRVTGHFGSHVFDIKRGRFRDGEDHGLPNGQICDDCVTELLREGLLIQEK